MSRTLWLVAAVLVAWAGISWWRSRAERISVPPPHRPTDDGIDHATLEEAEREVRDMESDPRGHPHEEYRGEDWGPGAPRS